MIINNVWEPLPDGLELSQLRLAEVLESWDGTPFRQGYSQKGVGAFCTSFVCHVLDELLGRDYLAVPDIPQDVGEHDRVGAIRNGRFFRRRYPLHEVLRPVQNYQPGDILVVGHRLRGPGHAMIVGAHARTLWQALGSKGVHYTGWGLQTGYKVHTAFRLKGREQWAQKP